MKNCPTCGHEIEERKTVIIDGWEYSVNDEQKGIAFENLIIPEGFELWDLDDCRKLYNDLETREQLNLSDCWFWIKQPFKFNEEKGLVARFGAGSGGASLDCGDVPSDSYGRLGVRFKRKNK